METSSDDIDLERRRQRTLRALQRRLVAHIQAGRTTDTMDAPMANAADVYTDPRRLSAERDKLFLRMPLVAGLSGDLPNAGDTLVFEGAGRPIIVVRNEEGAANAFLNICTHRGARPVAESGCYTAFSCPFHGWTFDLNGRLVGQPGHDCFRGLPADQLGLIQLPCTERHGLIFVCAQPGPEPIDVEAHLGSFGPVLEELRLDRFSAVKSGIMKAAGNWKYALETFGEGYHFAALHPDSLAQTHFNNVSAFDRFERHHRVCFAPRSYRALADLPEEQWPELDSVVYMIFPNTAMLVGSPMPGHLFVQLFRIYPTAQSATDVLFTLYAPADRLEGESRAVAEMGFDVARNIIENEDFRMTAAAQRNFLAAPAGFQVHYGRNEPALQHLHRDLADAVGMPVASAGCREPGQRSR